MQSFIGSCCLCVYLQCVQPLCLLTVGLEKPSFDRSTPVFLEILNLQENRSFSDDSTTECWNVIITSGWMWKFLSYFLGWKWEELLPLVFITVALNPAVLFLIVCLSHLPFCIQVHEPTNINQKKRKKQNYPTICYVQYFVEYVCFMQFSSGGTNLWSQ